MTTVTKLRGERSYWEQRYEAWWDHPFHGIAQATDEFMAAEQENVRQQLEGLLEPHHRVLDAGCGYGRLTEMIASRCREYVGVDFSFKAIGEAAHRAPENASFWAGDVVDFPCDEPFDVIVMVGMSSSLSYRPEVIEHLRTLLAPGGCIAMFDYGDDRILR